MWKGKVWSWRKYNLGRLLSPLLICFMMLGQPLERQMGICQGIKERKTVLQVEAILWAKVKQCGKCSVISIRKSRRLSGRSWPWKTGCRGRDEQTRGPKPWEDSWLCQAAAKRSLAMLRFLTSLSVHEWISPLPRGRDPEKIFWCFIWLIFFFF